MDKNMKKDIKDMAQAERLIDEENMNADNIAGAIEVNEDLEDKEELVIKLLRKLKRWNVTLAMGIIVLILIILFMLYTQAITYVEHDDPVKKPDSKIKTTEVIEENKDKPQVIKDKPQVINEKFVYYKLKCPKVNKNNLKHTSISKIASMRKDWTSCQAAGGTPTDKFHFIYEYVKEEKYRVYDSYLKKNIVYNIKADFVDTNGSIQKKFKNVILLCDLEKEFYTQPKKYEILDKEFKIPNPKKVASPIFDKKYHEYVLNWGEFLTKGEPNDLRTPFYNGYLVKKSPSVSKKALIHAAAVYNIELKIYDDVDLEKVNSAINNVITADAPYADIRKVFGLSDYKYTKYIRNFDPSIGSGVKSESIKASPKGIEDTANKLVDAIKLITPKFELSTSLDSNHDSDSIYYSYYDSVTTKDDKIVGIKDGNEEIPQVITNFHIKDYEILYDLLGSAYYYGWY